MSIVLCFCFKMHTTHRTEHIHCICFVEMSASDVKGVAVAAATVGAIDETAYSNAFVLVHAATGKLDVANQCRELLTDADTPAPTKAAAQLVQDYNARFSKDVLFRIELKNEAIQQTVAGAIMIHHTGGLKDWVVEELAYRRYFVQPTPFTEAQVKGMLAEHHVQMIDQSIAAFKAEEQAKQARSDHKVKLRQKDEPPKDERPIMNADMTKEFSDSITKMLSDDIVARIPDLQKISVGRDMFRGGATHFKKRILQHANALRAKAVEELRATEKQVGAAIVKLTAQQQSSK